MERIETLLISPTEDLIKFFEAAIDFIHFKIISNDDFAALAADRIEAWLSNEDP